jgi:hypothetical protein
MLIRTCGEFPTSKKQLRPENKAKHEKILERLDYKSPGAWGGFLEGSPGMGKQPILRVLNVCQTVVLSASTQCRTL